MTLRQKFFFSIPWSHLSSLCKVVQSSKTSQIKYKRIFFSFPFPPLLFLLARPLSSHFFFCECLLSVLPSTMNFYIYNFSLCVCVSKLPWFFLYTFTCVLFLISQFFFHFYFNNTLLQLRPFPSSFLYLPFSPLKKRGTPFYPFLIPLPIFSYPVFLVPFFAVKEIRKELEKG